MSGAVLERDPGPLARLAAVLEQPDAMQQIVDRLTDCTGDTQVTLKEICRSWQVPYPRVAEWILADRERAELYHQALRFAADNMVHETVPIADSADAQRDAVAKARLRIDTRLKVAGMWDRAKYGAATEVKHTGQVSLVAVLSSMPRGVVLDAEVVKPLPEPAVTAEPI